MLYCFYRPVILPFLVASQQSVVYQLLYLYYDYQKLCRGRKKKKIYLVSSATTTTTAAASIIIIIIYWYYYYAAVVVGDNKEMITMNMK